MKRLYFFTKNEIVFLAITRYYFNLHCETDIRIRIISGPQSFYFMINFFAIEQKQEAEENSQLLRKS